MEPSDWMPRDTEKTVALMRGLMCGERESSLVRKTVGGGM
jgi:hypothetical protein